MEFGVLFTSHPNHATEPYPHRAVHARVTAEMISSRSSMQAPRHVKAARPPFLPPKLGTRARQQRACRRRVLMPPSEASRPVHEKTGDRVRRMAARFMQ